MLARALMGGEIEEYLGVCSGTPGHPPETHPFVFQTGIRLDIRKHEPWQEFVSGAGRQKVDNHFSQE